MFIVMLFCLPETLYIRKSTTSGVSSPPRLGFTGYLNRMRLWSTYPELKLRAREFFIPALGMMRYPSVIFPALYYASQYGFASILPAVTVASIFEKFFHWDTLVSLPLVL